MGVLLLISIGAGWAAWTLPGRNSFQCSRWLGGTARDRGEMVRDLQSSGIL